jgi:hypothetical protein
MPKSLCLLFANCQGESLRPLLERTPAFARRFYVHHHVNYLERPIPDRLLDTCSVFLYQRLGDAWGELAASRLLPRLPRGCQAVEIPNLYFKGYWPFLTKREGMQFADGLLEDLLEKGFTDEQAMFLYLRADPCLVGDVEGVAAASIDWEREKERGADIGCVHVLEERWRVEPLFLTVNHPGLTLTLHVANAVLRLLGLGMVPGGVVRDYVHPYDDFWLPIHPVIGRRLGVRFAEETRRYRMHGGFMTHQEYVSCYLACRRNGVGKEFSATIGTLMRHWAGEIPGKSLFGLKGMESAGVGKCAAAPWQDAASPRQRASARCPNGSPSWIRSRRIDG